MAKTLIEALEAQKPSDALLSSDTSEGFKAAYDAAIALFKKKKGLTPEAEQRLARQE